MTIGVLGGGQLAQMLGLEGIKNGWDVRSLCQSHDDPAFAIGAHNTVGLVSDDNTRESFLSQLDLCTFESEFLDLENLDLKSNPKLYFFPDPQLMSQLSDRHQQKASLESHNLPTLPHLVVDTAEQALEAAEALNYKVVFKARRNSYDGYGTFVCRRKKDLLQFLDNSKSRLNEFILEPLIEMHKELAITVYRSKSGHTGAFSWVEWKAKDNKCHWVKGPYKSKPTKLLEPRLIRYLQKIDYVGVMAFEFFLTDQGLFINELAPRVHNSAHHSLTSSSLNQFVIHLMCGLGLKVPPKIDLETPGFAMVNLIGTSTKKPALKTYSLSHLHWYKKSENRKGRKLGHINALGKTPREALEKALKGARKCQV